MRLPKRLVPLFSGIPSRYVNQCSPCRWVGDVPTEGKVNSYLCKSGHSTYTIHADEGVTPFTISCHYCGETAYSRMYNDPRIPFSIQGVWSKKPNSWWGTDEQQQEHLAQGGVFLYAVKQGIEGELS